MAASTHLVLIPAYNPGPLLAETVSSALKHWPQVWVVVDGSTDGSEGVLPRSCAGLRVIVRSSNGGKGAAVLEGMERASLEGFTHALVMDADGQHPPGRIRDFMEASVRRPEALICGRPVFGPEAPLARLLGRKLSCVLVQVETLGRGAADPLFGFRVYPIAPLQRVLGAVSGGRRYDFDPEAAVRLAWAGVPAVNLPAACVYVPRERGGISHFNYVRDNATMVAMHAKILSELILGRGRVQAR